MKRKLSAFLAVLLMIFLTGCDTNLDEVSSSTDTTESSDSTSDGNDSNPDEVTLNSVLRGNSGKVGYYGKIIKTVNRTKPEVSNEGLSEYPTYGSTFSKTVEEREAVAKENDYLRASSSTYDAMDKDGNLYLNGEKLDRHLYKHTAAITNYGSEISDDEKAVVKQMTITNRAYGNSITGLYAPAGEVIKITLSAETLAKIGSLEVVIGQAAMRGNENVIPTSKAYTRMPKLVNKMTVSSEISYVGSFLGGPIYIRPTKSGTYNFDVEISGALEYQHYIHGYTTEEEYNARKNTTVPYFDFEVWDDGVRHSGLYSNVKHLDYENMAQSGELWENIRGVSNQFPTGSLANIGISFIYDTYVFVGAAVAIVGQNWCNLPHSWLVGALDYKQFTSEGAWGVIHEYNHHYQIYGLPNGGEVTNNAVSLISYILYTNISSKRTESGSTLSWWNRYTVPSISLKETVDRMDGTDSQYALNVYADLLHTFGPDIFINAARLGSGSTNSDVYYKNFSNAAQYDLTYYFEEMLNITISDDVKQEIQSKNYPVFVPVASPYQTGRSYLKDGEIQFSNTVHPFMIEYKNAKLIDLNSQLVVPNGVSYEVKEVTDPEYGTITRDLENKALTYTPDENNILSGKIYVTITLTSDNSLFEPQDVVLQMEFKQKNTGFAYTTYQYTSETAYTDLTFAEANNFAGYEEVTSGITSNLSNKKAYTITLLEGKIYMPTAGKYRLGIAGAKNVFVYTSLNNQTPYKLTNTISPYEKVTNINQAKEPQFEDFTVNQGDYIYFKALINNNTSSDNGFVQFALAKYDENGNVGSFSTVNDKYIVPQELTYNDEQFSADAYYKRNYTASYINYLSSGSATLLSYSESFSQWDNSYSINNIFDGNTSTTYHSAKGSLQVTKDNPFELVVDANETKFVNFIKIYGYNKKDFPHVPTSFKLYGGTSLDDMKLLGDYENVNIVESRNVIVNFNPTLIRYYKLVITETSTFSDGNVVPSDFIAISHIDLGLEAQAKQYSIDSSFVKYSADFIVKNDRLSTFGHYFQSTNGVFEVNFTGSKFGFYTHQDDNLILEIQINDGEYERVMIDKYTDYQLSYFNNQLTYGKNKVRVRVISGTLNLDSFIIG